MKENNNLRKDNFMNEIIRQKTLSRKSQTIGFGNMHDVILFYLKSKDNPKFNVIYEKRDKEVTAKRFPLIDENGKRYSLDSFTQVGQGQPRYFGEKYGFLSPPNGKHWIWSQERIDEGLKTGKIKFTSGNMPRLVRYETEGLFCGDIWIDTAMMFHSQSVELLDYPTQKPEALLERIIKASSNPGDLVFDCFMGSGTTQAVAMKLGRRFIGADINLGAIQTTTKRLLSIMSKENDTHITYPGFEVYNVNNYDIFRNPIEAKEILMDALEIQQFPLDSNSPWDGELDGRMVKLMPVNRIANKEDIDDLISRLPYKTYEAKMEMHPFDPVEKITLVCMGHDPALKASFELRLKNYNIDLQILDILRDKSELKFKRESEADIQISEDGKMLEIKAFYPMNLMAKLSADKNHIADWRRLVDSIMIDFNYDGAVMSPSVIDIPQQGELVKGCYTIPRGYGTIRVKITDLLSESLELNVSQKTK